MKASLCSCWVAAAAVWLLACFDAAPPTGAACSETGACPAGQTCDPGTNTCVRDDDVGTVDGGEGCDDERCNEVDDDCDGRIDEGFDVGAACSVGDGECLASGVLACTDDGADVECTASAREPGEEICDGLDNDCSGAADEPWTDLGEACSVGTGACERQGEIICGADGTSSECSAVAGMPADKEVCGDDVDDTCDGALDDGCECTDPGAVKVCGPMSTQGICEKGTQTCGDDGKWGDCEGAVYPAPNELCNGLDDNCNGQTDEGLGGGSCTNGQQGVCLRSGTMVCNGATGNLECNAPAVTPGNETCNGLDDDCDGTPDDNLGGGSCTNGQQGECLRTGTLTCDGGTGMMVCSAPQVPAGTETCNGLDDDCDGTPDDGLGGGSCTNGQQGVCLRNGTLVCNGASGTLTCDAPQITPGTETCNGMDDDCDGQTDEGIPPTCDGNVLTSCGQSVDCGAQGQACFNNACTGVCVPDERRCVPGSNAHETCALNGQWSNQVQCHADGLDWEVCRQGACVESVQYGVGHTDAGQWSSTSTLPAGYWRTVPITVDEDVVLFSLNVFLADVPAQTGMQLALWENASDQPGSLVATTAYVPAKNGLNRIDINELGTQLAAGTTYWVGVITSNSCKIPRKAVSGALSAAVMVNAPNANPPDPFPNVSTSSGWQLGLYLRVKDQF